MVISWLGLVGFETVENVQPTLFGRTMYVPGRKPVTWKYPDPTISYSLVASGATKKNGASTVIVPLAESNVECELTTPTGAAIIAALVDAFGPVPAMKIDRIGYGAGQADLEEQANLLRLLVGETDDARSDEQLWVLETNLDDISGELVGHTAGKLWEAGALDVYTTAIGMKKNRPGVTLSVLSDGIHVPAIEDILFRETTTLGIRRWKVERRKLKREAHRVETPWGPVDGVLAWLDADTARFSPEYESCRKLADEHNVPLKAVYEAAQQAYRARG